VVVKGVKIILEFAVMTVLESSHFIKKQIIVPIPCQ
jgi:hypothetical protein